ncbi:MAG TPA: lipocalin-like domain-containing protein [Bryobacteraceae bacterium]|nr:lipocalin-like domain-containing protein [Bryobacteraceae bacterium]
MPAIPTLFGGLLVAVFAAWFNTKAVTASELYRAALPGYRYEFPRDHFNHPGFQTEWWYYTGNLRNAQGRRFGFELTFFRQGVDRGNDWSNDWGKDHPASLWDVRDAWLAHLALSDVDGGRFLHAERLNRAGPGLAGASLDLARVWNGNWRVQWHLRGGTQQIEAIDPRFSFNLTLRALKPPVVHGINGVSQKAADAGRASHYISFTRLETQGDIVLEGRTFHVEGLSWMDHEFFTQQLDPAQSGWDWFSLQFDDGTELMLFRLRRKDGAADPYSAGTYIDARGRTTHLARDMFSVTPGKLWNKYPVEWSVRVPSLGIAVQLTTRLPQQEFDSKENRYWEGAVEIGGTRHGAGYAEMTGYAAPVRF